MSAQTAAPTSSQTNESDWGGDKANQSYQDYQNNNFYTDNGSVLTSPEALFAVEMVLVAIACVGVFVNLACFLLVHAMQRKLSTYWSAEAVLLQQQAISDLVACSLAVAIAFYNPNVSPAANALYWQKLLCYLLYSQMLFWWPALFSIFNMTLQALLWLFAVCFPEKHATVLKHFGRLLLLMHVFAICFSLPCLFSLTVLPSGACLQPKKYKSMALSGFFISWTCTWALLSYLLPVGLIGGSYGYLIRFCRQQVRTLAPGPQQRKVAREAKHVLKCLLSLVVFILAVGADTVQWILDLTSTYTYVFNSPRQRLSVLAMTLNFSANPLVHVLCSPEVRSFVRGRFRLTSRSADSSPPNAQPVELTALPASRC